ncbi:HipA domain-containing protein [Terrimonas rubra]|uniref:HipA domain-containing protein n=1 Tax=Terrimonas rubra TaxID=1035890 RepID=A0ABW6AC93_9BACT
MSKRCLYCYQPTDETGGDFHPACSRQFFGSPVPPALAISQDEMQEMAQAIVLKSIAVTGVQPKLSLSIEPTPGDPKNSRFTIVGLWGNFILKPPTAEFKALPENEDLTMQLAGAFGLSVAEHSLIRLSSGELAYITKRFDRNDKEKLALEDMCQLTETLTSDKYRGSMEKVGKTILRYSTQPGLDAIRFFEYTLFCFLTGNADMHLKNFSLLSSPEGNLQLSPAYDLLCTQLALPEDLDEIALTLNAKQRKLKLADFMILAEKLKIPAKTVNNVLSRFKKQLNTVNSWIDISFLPDDLKHVYKNIVRSKALQVELV